MERATWKDGYFFNCISGHVGEAVKDPETDTNPPAGKEKSVAEPIIVPIVLKMAEFDHKVWLNS